MAARKLGVRRHFLQEFQLHQEGLARPRGGQSGRINAGDQFQNPGDLGGHRTGCARDHGRMVREETIII